MKIHFIISKLSGGGAERVATLLATNMAKKDKYDVSIITFNKGQEYDISEEIKRVSLDNGTIRNHTIRSFINLFRYYRKSTNRPDIIISFITLTNLITIPISKLYSIKIIAAEHNNHLRNMGPVFLSKFTKKYLYRKADILSVLTSYDVPYYEKFGANVMVIPNPCTFKPLEKYITKREKVILAMGKLDRYHHKGFDNLIAIISPVLKSNPDWKLKIVGSGDQGYNFLSNLVKQYKIDDQVIFTGFQTNVSEIMQKSSIFILTSRYEGLPMVLLEAMSQGMACIAYNCISGPSDIIENNKNGLLIEDQNQEAMQNSLIELIKDEELRILLGQNSIKSLKKYNIDSIIEDYGNIFDKMVEKK